VFDRFAVVFGNIMIKMNYEFIFYHVALGFFTTKKLIFSDNDFLKVCC